MKPIQLENYDSGSKGDLIKPYNQGRSEDFDLGWRLPYLPDCVNATVLAFEWRFLCVGFRF